MSKTFDGYLPPNAFVMAKRGTPKKTTVAVPAPAASATPASAAATADFGEGDPRSPLVFIGGLGGPNGPLLDKMIEAMGKKRQQVYITPLLTPSDAALCVQTLQPKVVVALGKPAAQSFSKVALGSIKLIATHHPDDMIQNPAAKKECWEQLKIAMNTLGWKK